MYRYIKCFSDRLGNIGAKLNDDIMPAIKHLIKAYLYSNSESLNHWILEIYSFLHEVKLVKGKNKPPKSNYIYKQIFIINEPYLMHYVEGIVDVYGESDYDSTIINYISDYCKWISDMLSSNRVVTYCEVKDEVMKLLRSYRRLWYLRWHLYEF